MINKLRELVHDYWEIVQLPLYHAVAYAVLGFAVSLYLSPLHELGHYAVGFAKGYAAEFHFDRVTFADREARLDPLITAAGPAASFVWGLLFIGTSLFLWRDERYKSAAWLHFRVFLFFVGLSCCLSHGLYNLYPDKSKPHKDGSILIYGPPPAQPKEGPDVKR